MKQDWYQKYLSVYGKPYDEVPHPIVNEVKQNLAHLQSDSPLVTVSVIAYNEEKHLLACLWSLSEMQCHYPVEIIGVDNGSKDSTSQILDDLDITWYVEPKKGPGHARNCALQKAKGVYHLCIDADTLYPCHYVERMVQELQKDNVSCVYGLWSFIPDVGYPRWQLRIYEALRNMYLYVQNLKRPELCVRGMSFGFKTDMGRKTGFRSDIRRGEDGSMALAMKPYGKLKLVTSSETVVYTGLGTLKADGSFFNSFKVRVIKALKGVGNLFTRKDSYDDADDNIIKE